jgi:hypothetical protein
LKDDPLAAANKIFAGHNAIELDFHFGSNKEVELGDADFRFYPSKRTSAVRPG